MTNNLKLINYLSVVLLCSVIIGQGSWFYKVWEMKTDELRQQAGHVLSVTYSDYISNTRIQTMKNNPQEAISCSMPQDSHTFIYHYNRQTKEIPLTSTDRLNELTEQVYYDALHQTQRIDLKELEQLYQEALRKKDIFQTPVLVIRDSISDKQISATSAESPTIVTAPLNLGYENKHQLTAAFEPSHILRSMARDLIAETIFIFGFVICLVWQWQSIRATWQCAQVQTTGIAHLEHELKKPLAILISAVEGILAKTDTDRTDQDQITLKAMKAKQLKMSNIMSTMLTALKTSRLVLERVPVDLEHELAVVREMFRELKPHTTIRTNTNDLPPPLLDEVYFTSLLINLVDNGSKYGGEQPEIRIQCRREGKNLFLEVEDNGIGIPQKEQRRIFRQFYRIRNKKTERTTGFGLGLTFVKQVVTAYQGRISVESEPGKGSKFIITIPQAWKS